MFYTTTRTDNKIAMRSTHRMSRRSFLRNVGVGLALTLPLAACAAPASPPPQEGASAGEAAAPAAENIQIELMSPLSDDWASSLNQVLNIFHKNNPRIEVQHRDAGGRGGTWELLQKLMASYAAGDGPDLVLLTPIPNGIDFYLNGFFEPLDNLIEQVGLKQEDFLENTLKANRSSLDSKLPYDGELIGIPLTVSPVAALFNKDHVLQHTELDADSPPETLDELIGWAQVLTDYSDELEPRSGFILGNHGYLPSTVFSILGTQLDREGEVNPEIPAAD